MSIALGPVRQIGYVVSNLDQAIQRWIGLGIGPFFRIDHMPLSSFRVAGVETAIDLSVACAHSGEVQIELIEQHNPEPSPYKDFLDRYGPGMQHLGTWSKDYDADVARLISQGYRVAFDGESRGAARFTYFDAPFEPGTFMELADLTDSLEIFCREIRVAATEWDGTNPIRRLELNPSA